MFDGKSLIIKLYHRFLDMVSVPRRWIGQRKIYGYFRKNSDKTYSRVYGSYSAYVTHQKRKSRYIFQHQLSVHSKNLTSSLFERLKDLDLYGKSVLCLGARNGAEVISFLQKGCFAIGVDLRPMNHSYVIEGDFNKLPFSDKSVDVIYTNSLDHSINLMRTIKEIARVLKPHGLFILNAPLRHVTPITAYESLCWDSIQVVKKQIETILPLKSETLFGKQEVQFIFTRRR